MPERAENSRMEPVLFGGEKFQVEGIFSDQEKQDDKRQRT